MVFEILTFLFVCVSLGMILRNRHLSAELNDSRRATEAFSRVNDSKSQEILDLRKQKHECWEHSQKCLEKVARRDEQIANQRDAIRDLHSAIAEIRAERDQALEFFGSVEDLVKAEQPRLSTT